MSEVVRDVDRWTAAQCRLSRRLFEICGRHGAVAASPAVAVSLTSIAGALAWHGELYFDLLPVRVDIDRDALVAAGVYGGDAALDELAGVLATDEAAGVAALSDVVLTRLLAGVEVAEDVVVRALDGPRWRALRLISRDLADLRRDVELLATQTPVADPAAAARGRAAIEQHLVAADVGVGLCAGPEDRVRG